MPGRRSRRSSPGSARSDPRAFAIAVSDAVRVYLEERFQLRAPERTTEEFLRDLQKTPVLTEQQKKSLSDFLEQCDLVKFAKVSPGAAEARGTLEMAIQIVKSTQPHPTAPAAPVGPTPHNRANPHG